MLVLKKLARVLLPVAYIQHFQSYYHRDALCRLNMCIELQELCIAL